MSAGIHPIFLLLAQSEKTFRFVGLFLLSPVLLLFLLASHHVDLLSQPLSKRMVSTFSSENVGRATYCAEGVFAVQISLQSSYDILVLTQHALDFLAETLGLLLQMISLTF
jgi:hypothetical protein